MILDRMDQAPGLRVLFSMACVVVVVAGLRFAAPILLPAALALFLAILMLPVMVWLRRRGVPGFSAIVISVLINVAIVFGLASLATSQFSELQAVIPDYYNRLVDLQAGWVQSIEAATDLVISDYFSLDLFIEPGTIVAFAGDAVGRVAQLLVNTLLVFIIMAFMLSEAMVFPAKFQHITGTSADDEDRLTKVVTEVQTYLGIKTVISIFTGLVLGVWAWAMGLDFPLLLGVIAFIFNYVPTVGSIIAAIPAVLLSLILVQSIPHALGVSAGYVVVNMLFGNMLEPSLMGRRLGLSTLVVILSLIFWYWVWGPIGALLSVPLTVIVKIWLENTPDLRWIAVLLDKDAPEPDDPMPEAAD